MDKNYKWKLLVIICLTAFSVWKIFPPQEKIPLGLDLKGGMHLLFRVDTEKIAGDQDAKQDAVNRALEVIRNRIDQFGVAEPSIQKQGIDQVVIQLPGITDRQRALELIGKTAVLEFKMVAVDNDALQKALAGNVPEGYELKTTKEFSRQGMPARSENLLLESKALMTGDHLTNAVVSFDQSAFGQPIVAIEFDSEGAKTFNEVTSDAVRRFQQDGIPRRVAIVLDGEVRSAPQVRSAIPDGRAQIEGSFSYDEASDLALVLRAGALPAPVILEEDRVVGPNLGKDSIQKGTQACVIGMIAVGIFMILYYMIPGIVATTALFLMLLLTLGGLVAFGATLSLPGIAGLVLTLGMAVDANVLIFERIREELKTGKTSRAAISVGYHKAFGAIFDSNLTTLFTSVALFYFGSGPIKGFAVTLSIGIVASMLTAIVFTRLVFDTLSRGQKEVNLRMLSLFKNNLNFDYIGKRKWAYIFSTVLLVGGMAYYFYRGQGMYGVDFSGGILQQVRFQQNIDLGKLRGELNAAGVEGSIQNFGEAGKNEVLLRSAETDPKKIETVLAAVAGNNGYEILRSETVGPSAEAALRKNALKAFVFSMLLMIAYVSYRYSFYYSLSAIVALLHDALVCLVVIAIAGREVSLTVISAVLTIIGFSINDTIVIYDRIRENKKIMKKLPFAELVNLTLNQTLSRTVLTSFTVLLVTGVLFFFGGSVINDFALTMIAGVISGTYSTIFVASSLLVDWKKGY